MKAIVLAAGLGTRLGSVTRTIPKILAPVAGRPLLDLQLEYLRASGVEEVGLNLHHHADVVIAHLRDSAPALPVRVSVEERLLGTAGALLPLRDMLTEDFVLLYGDVLTDVDLSALMTRHVSAGAFATLAVHEEPDVSAKGVVELDPMDRITAFREKPGDRARGWVNSGIYVLSPAVLDRIPPPPADFGYDVWPRALDDGLRLQGCPVDGYLRDVGSPSELQAASRDVTEGLLAW